MYVSKQVASYIEKTNYEQIILLRDPKVWRGKIMAACRRASRKKIIPFKSLREREPWTKNTIENLAAVIREAVKPT
jgi:hypothetical protein